LDIFTVEEAVEVVEEEEVPLYTPEELAELVRRAPTIAW